jgi:hypothetical protein
MSWHPTRKVYALDIETDTTPDPFVDSDGVASEVPAGLDPRVSTMTAYSIVGSDGTFIAADGPDEGILVTSLVAALKEIADARGLLVTWNGNGFDLPWIAIAADRAIMCDKVLLAPRCSVDEVSEPKYGWPEWRSLVPLAHRIGGRIPGLDGWDARHPMFGKVTGDHLDISEAFRPVAEKFGVRASLKPVHEAVTGEALIEVDRSKVSDLTRAERLAYVASDAEGTLRLALMLLNGEVAG